MKLDEEVIEEVAEVMKINEKIVSVPCGEYLSCTRTCVADTSCYRVTVVRWHISMFF